MTCESDPVCQRKRQNKAETENYLLFHGFLTVASSDENFNETGEQTGLFLGYFYSCDVGGSESALDREAPKIKGLHTLLSI
jgi:hypothetical protein